MGLTYRGRNDGNKHEGVHTRVVYNCSPRQRGRAGEATFVQRARARARTQ